MDFKVGDKVRILISHPDNRFLRNNKGVIVTILENVRNREATYYGVDIENFQKGHDCDEILANKSGWYFLSKELQLIDQVKLKRNFAKFISNLEKALKD